jgi:hypothetical protein
MQERQMTYDYRCPLCDAHIGSQVNLPEDMRQFKTMEFLTTNPNSPESKMFAHMLAYAKEQKFFEHQEKVHHLVKGAESYQRVLVR